MFSSKYKLFYKYFLSYCILFIIPLLFMAVLINTFFVNIFKDETEKSYTSILHHIISNIDNNVTQINIITETISTDPKFTPLNIDLHPENWIETVDSLRKYAVSNTIIGEMYVFFNGGNKIYSSHGTFSYETFAMAMQNKYGCGLDEMQPLIATSKTSLLPTGKEVKLKGSRGNLIFFFRPILHGSIAYVIDEDKLRSYVNNSFSDYHSNTIILNNSNEIIVSQDINSTIDSPLLNDVVNLKGNGSKNILLNKQRYFLCYSRSNKTGWLYATIIPVSDVLKKVNYVQYVSFLSILLVSSICFVLTYYMMKMNYNPLKKLVNLFTENSAINISSENEIAAIQKAMDGIFVANKKARELVEKNKIAFKEYLLLNLLKGKIRSVEEFNNLGQEYGLYFTKKSFVVLYILFHNFDSKIIPKEYVVGEIEEYLYEKYEGYCKDNIDDNSLYFILGVDGEGTDVKDAINSLIRFLNVKYNLKCTVGIGRAYDVFCDIPRSYIESNMAMDYSILLGTDRAITYDEVKLIKKESTWYPDKEISEIKKNLYFGNFENISTLMDTIITNIKNYKFSPFMIKSTLFEITNVVIKVIQELKLYDDFEEDKIIDVVELSKYKSFEEVLPVITNFFKEFCTKIKLKKESQNFELIEKILGYIQKNYCSPDMSLQSIGAYFNISTSYLSRYFKDQTGNTVLQYITDLRLNKCKELLLGTELQINCIVEKVGFLDVTSFSRWFKQQTGTSAGRFRQEHQSN